MLARISLPAVMFLFILTPLKATKYAAPQAAGDWIISDTEVVENENIILTGNLVVQNTGNLTLRNTHLTLNAQLNGQYGIRVRSGGSITIESGTIITSAADNAHLTFVVEANASFVMRDSELHQSGWGVPYGESCADTVGLAIHSANAVLERNLISGNFTGVYLQGTGASIRDNRLTENQWTGITLCGIGGAQISGNTIADAVTGVWTVASDSNQIAKNFFARHYEGAVFIMSGQGNEIRENQFAVDGEGFQGWVGVELDKASTNNRVLNNSFTGGKNGIAIHHSFNNLISGNTIHRPQHAIWMGYAHNNVLADNVADDVGGNGFCYGAMFLYWAGENKILNNRISLIADSAAALNLMGHSSGNRVAGNTIAAKYRGVVLHSGATKNTITNNSISAESDESILISGSSGNSIHHNNFLNSAKPPLDDGNNKWDDGTSGNFWGAFPSNATYPIKPNGTDNYPLSSIRTISKESFNEPAPVGPIAPPFYPPMVITGDVTIEDQTLAIDDQLVIQAGGSLTLKRTKLIIDGGRDIGGVFVMPGGSLSIYDSSVIATDRGGGYLFQAQQGSKLIVKKSEIRGVGFSWGTDWSGLYIQTDNAIIEDSLITDTFAGLVLPPPSTQAITIMGNVIVNGFYGIRIIDQINTLISGNRIENSLGWAIAITGGSGVSVIDNSVSNILSLGGLVLSGAGHSARGNTITSVRSGWGINCSGEGHHIESNTISDASWIAIGLTGSKHAVQGNTIANAGTALNIGQTQDSIFADNRASLIMNYGINLGESSNNSFFRNIISKSDTAAILQSGVNIFSQNDFRDNRVQVVDFGNNYWDSEGTGNYWSDYTGSDLNGDGIGDTPYAIMPSGSDRYPLISPNNKCTYSITPDALSIGAMGGTGTFTIKGPNGCSWTAVRNDLWIAFNGEESGVGDGTVSFEIPARSSPYSRTGSISIGDQAFTIVQDGTSQPSAPYLWLNGNRFVVEVDWSTASGASGKGTAVPLTSDSGYFWFFGDSNVELMVKILDGRAVNSHFWVFYGALTDVQYTITVTDTATGEIKTYLGQQGAQQSGNDIHAFADSEPAPRAPDPVKEAKAFETALRGLNSGSNAASAGSTELHLNGNRFTVRINWSTPSGSSGQGTAVPLTSDSGYFWFFGDTNVEVLVKILDGRGTNGHFWFFWGAMTDVRYTITITDTVVGTLKTYEGQQGVQRSGNDIMAF